MKKLLAMLLALSLTFSLVACGGGEEEPAAAEKPAASDSADVAEEEPAEEAPAEEEPADEAVDTTEFVAAYESMLEAYNAVADAANQYPEFMEANGYTDAMNELGAAVDEMTASIDLENVTEADMEEYATGMMSTLEALQAMLGELVAYEEALAAEAEAPAADEGGFSIDYILENTAYAYGGDSGADSLFMCFDETMSSAVYVATTMETMEYICLTGALYDNGDGSTTLVDDATGTEILFALVDNGDGTITYADEAGASIVMGELDYATLEAVLVATTEQLTPVVF